MILWFCDGYRAYACCILIISVMSVVTSLIETVKNLKNIRHMAHYSCPVKVMRSGNENVLTDMESTELVPGDVIEIPEMCNMPCDLVLLTGSAIVNESMLTGESIPVIKNALPFTNDVYSPESDSKYTLYGGTKVIQSRQFGTSRVLGLVIRTAFVTTKGNLVRDILYPKSNKFKFYRDSLVFIGVMALLAVAGFCTTLPIMIQQNYPFLQILDRSLDLITITVPPALPAAMTIGTVFAINRLKRTTIFCISPPRVNVSGRVNMMVFDKTGTLTEDGLQVYGFRGVD
jgi:cation-transporting ATPase 13A2